MTLFHDYFTTRDQQAFQRLLASSIEAAASGHGPSKSPSSSSWKKPSTLTMTHMGYPLPDINTRDQLGRTVLHLACAAPPLECTEYVRLLLKHPAIQVNLPDQESQWTPLHRALYNGNIDTVLVLLQHPDIDLRAKDFEGYSPFDLYNSTVEGPKPSSTEGFPASDNVFDLLTWGANRNAALAHGDAADRSYPDPVAIPAHPNRVSPTDSTSLEARFTTLRVKQIVMSKFHTVVVTDETNELNLRVCGFGSGGRLGTSQHTQYSLFPLPGGPKLSVARVALGQDHTIIMTDSGEVYTWGFNRFSQLGYVIESSTQPIKSEAEQIQSTPKRILGPLKKEVIKGIAASKCASCAWNQQGELYTWGTNHGQLGYDRNAQPVQIQPRRASRITKAVLDVAMTDSAIACLLETRDVLCVWRDMHFKINFSTSGFPSTIQPYRPPPRTNISKVMASEEGSFAALSSVGEVFTFTVPLHTDTTFTAKEDIKPHLAWALRKQFTSVTDVALGADGSMVLCTESGHVFVRDWSTPAKKHAGSSKWTRVPYIQRAVAVNANSTGSFAVLRRGYVPNKIELEGPLIQDDLLRMVPFLYLPRKQADPNTGADSLAVRTPLATSAFTFSIADNLSSDHLDEDDVSILKDIQIVNAMARFLQHTQHYPLRNETPQGADILVRVDAVSLPVHRAILACRSKVLATLLAGGKVTADRELGISVKYRASNSGLSALVISNAQPFTVMLMLHYLYTDDFPALWDLRVLSLSVLSGSSSVKLRGGPDGIKRELSGLARLLDLPALLPALAATSKLSPEKTLSANLKVMHQTVQKPSASKGSLRPDVVLHLEDKDVFTHSVLLRARSPVFAAFFDDKVWTLERYNQDNKPMEINLRHLRWHIVEYVLRFMLCGEEDLFDVLPFTETVDDVLEFMFDVMAVATELLLDRLVLICCRVIQRYIAVHNASYILTDATHFNASALVERVQAYLTANLEGFLESNLLYDLSPYVIRELSGFIRHKQSEKMNLGRIQEVTQRAMLKHAEWLAMEDFPEPMLRCKGKVKEPSRLSPTLVRKRSSLLALAATTPTQHLPERAPTPQSLPTALTDDGIFLMDEADPSSVPIAASSPVGPTWKLPSVPRVDMKSVMAEEATRVTGNETESHNVKFSQRPSQRERKAQASASHPSPAPSPAPVPLGRSAGSPWKAIPTAQASTLTSITPPPRAPPSSPFKGSGLASKQPSTPPRPSASQSDLGPVFAPARHSPGRPAEGSTRRVSSLSSGAQKPWSLASERPVVQPTDAPTKGVSLIAIQQLQIEQDIPQKQDKRSLLEIQREEAERQQEEDFMRWWAEEEARMKSSPAAACSTSTARSDGKTGGKKKTARPSLKGGEKGTGDSQVPGSSKPRPHRNRSKRANAQQAAQ